MDSSYHEISEEVGPSGSTANSEYFCHECDKKFSCEKSEGDDVSDSSQFPLNVKETYFYCIGSQVPGL